MQSELKLFSVSRLSHHDPSEEADAAAAVGVRDHVSVTNGQEGDGNHPQGLHVVAAQVPVVVVSAGVKVTQLVKKQYF